MRDLIRWGRKTLREFLEGILIVAKLLRPRDRLLLAFAVIGDILEEIPTRRDFLNNLYGFYPKEYSRNNYLQAFYRSRKTGNIEKVIKKGEPYWRLTGKGKRRLIRDFPLLKFRDRPWDGKWRTVIFDIEEKSRDERRYLREKLRELGFGMLQRSVYISPFDVAEDLREYFAEQKLGERVYVLEAKRLFAEDEGALAEKVWSLEKINDEYEKLLDRWERGRNLKGEAKKNLFREIKSRYLEILASDPFLPEELLPRDWVGDKVRKLLLSFPS